jgi:uncharacterized protein YraI
MGRELIEQDGGALTATMGRSMDRRNALRLMLGVGAAAVAGGASIAFGDDAAARSGDGRLRTIAALNLRAQPSTSAKILLVMPKGAVVTNGYQEQNGFIWVTYQGTPGWAHGSYLVADTADTIIGQGVTTTTVNFRNGPSTNDGVIAVFSKGALVDMTDRVENGFRSVISGDISGWIFDQLLAPYGGEGAGPARFTTTTAVNLRAQPSTSAKILLVVPAGETVLDYDLVMSNGFRGVDYNGTVGWIYDAYLE